MIISMIKYPQRIIHEFLEVLRGAIACPGDENKLFKIQEDAEREGGRRKKLGERKNVWTECNMDPK